MPTKEELRQIISRISEIYINAKENFNYCYYLHKPATEEEAKYLTIDRNLKFIRHSLWRLSIIELAKLYSNKRNDKFSLRKLISKFTSIDCSDLNISRMKSLEWESRIISKGIAIDHVNLLRDKIYAHTDADKENYREIELYFFDIEALFEIASIIIKDIYFTVFDISMDLRTPTFDRKEFEMVRVLAKDHKRRVDEIRNLIKPTHG